MYRDDWPLKIMVTQHRQHRKSSDLKRGLTEWKFTHSKDVSTSCPVALDNDLNKPTVSFYGLAGK